MAKISPRVLAHRDQSQRIGLSTLERFFGGHGNRQLSPPQLESLLSGL